MPDIFQSDFNDFIFASTKLKGLNFDDAFKHLVKEMEGLKVNYLQLNYLIQAKRAAGRFKDLDDIEKLGNIQKGASG